MCFLREWNCGFFAKAMAPWLSPKMTVAAGYFISLRNWERSDCSQIASLVAWVCATYSASQEDKETVGCLFEDQLIAPLPILNRKPEVERRVSISPAQSESVYPTNGLGSPQKVNSSFVVPWRYCMIRLVARICWGPGFPKKSTKKWDGVGGFPAQHTWAIQLLLHTNFCPRESIRIRRARLLSYWFP